MAVEVSNLFCFRRCRSISCKFIDFSICLENKTTTFSPLSYIVYVLIPSGALIPGQEHYTCHLIFGMLQKLIEGNEKQLRRYCQCLHFKIQKLKFIENIFHKKHKINLHIFHINHKRNLPKFMFYYNYNY